MLSVGVSVSFRTSPKNRKKGINFLWKYIKEDDTGRGPPGGLTGRGRRAVGISGCRGIGCPHVRTLVEVRNLRFVSPLGSRFQASGFLGFEITYMNWQNWASKVGLEGFAKKNWNGISNFCHYNTLLAGGARKTREDGSGEHPHDTICFSSFDIKLWSFNINFRRQIHRNT